MMQREKVKRDKSVAELLEKALRAAAFSKDVRKPDIPVFGVGRGLAFF